MPSTSGSASSGPRAPSGPSRSSCSPSAASRRCARSRRPARPGGPFPTEGVSCSSRRRRREARRGRPRPRLLRRDGRQPRACPACRSRRSGGHRQVGHLPPARWDSARGRRRQRPRSGRKRDRCQSELLGHAARVRVLGLLREAAGLHAFVWPHTSQPGAGDAGASSSIAPAEGDLGMDWELEGDEFSEE